MDVRTDKKAEQSLKTLQEFVTPELLASILEDYEYDPEVELRTLVDIAKTSTSGALKMRAIAMIRKLVEDTLKDEKDENMVDESIQTAFAPQIKKGNKLNDLSKSTTKPVSTSNHKSGRASELTSGICNGQ